LPVKGERTAPKPGTFVRVTTRPASGTDRAILLSFQGPLAGRRGGIGRIQDIITPGRAWAGERGEGSAHVAAERTSRDCPRAGGHARFLARKNASAFAMPNRSPE